MTDIIEKFESSLNVLKTILQKEGLTLGAQTAVDLLAQIEEHKKEKLIFFSSEAICFQIEGPFTDVPEDQQYIGYVRDDKYKGTVATGASKGDVIKELGISIEILDKYRAKNIIP